ncbi:MAG: 6-phosphofructokinase [Eubacteriales bacterium]|nr:6-phosphofructokinase [Eubacteriales bacterium]MDY2933017.1 6-phosphofructokinase [Anaerovoracaceae bacterium]
MKKIGVLTSGGDSPGMNAAIRAVVRCGIDRGMTVYGISRGYEGLIDGDIREMDRASVGGIIHRGGTVLGTARSERFMTAKGQDKAVSVLEAFGIEGLAVIGGNGSLTGALELDKRGIKIMGIPGTIDNDLGYTDYTIGFDTAVNTVLDDISKLRDTSSSHGRTTLVEVMGRNCGDIALRAGLAGGAEFVMIPERDYDIGDVCRKILEGAARGKKHSIIIKAEGSKLSSQEVVDKISEITGKDTRMVVLSYLQRGGSPTSDDRVLATMAGAKAAELLYDDADSKAIGIVGNKITVLPLYDALQITRDIDPYMLELVDVLSK